MVFSSLIFLFVFLPIVLVLYFITPNRFKNVILLLSSLFFYTWGEGDLVLLLIGSSVFNYFIARYIQGKNKKAGLVLSIFFNLGLLGFFKYFNFTIDNINQILSLFGMHSETLNNASKIALPIGISFYTFQALSYCIDVYYGKIRANKNYIEFATYLCMFPQLVAGPIVRYIDIEAKFKERQPNIESISNGVERFMIGFSKKIIIANPLSQIADEIFAMNYADLSTSLAWLGIFAYSMQIYFDFSGYSDMAIGLGKMFGYDFLENFNYPYISKSIKEFWRRWHISLSSWFKDYLYIPLGGNRKGATRTYVNLFIVFATTGLWHGASWNFIVWGLFYAVFLVIERLGFNKVLEKLPKVIAHIYALFVIVIGWVFFRANSLTAAVSYILSMFRLAGNDWANFRFVINNHYIFTIIVGIILSIPFPKLKAYIDAHEGAKIVRDVFVVLAFVVAVCFMVGSGYSPFLYFRF